MSRPDITFVVTPFLSEHQPALGVSSLIAVLRDAGLRADIRYLNIDFAQKVGLDLVSRLGNGLPVEYLAGEMIFTSALWADGIPRWSRYVERLLTLFRGRAAADIRRLMEAAAELHSGAPQIVAGWADALLVDPPRILGFTSTFQQNVASLALAREIRSRVPSERVAILFGGANCEGDMGRALAENFPFIDHVVSGEAEGQIVDLCGRLLKRDAPGAPRFVAGRGVTDMNALPLPVFDDYFDAIAASADFYQINQVAESSRGCWWGEKSHCTFCGLNGSSMAYRSKTPERFVDELRTLKRRHGSGLFMLADNIMDMRYVRTLLPMLAADDERFELFYETKANLRKEQLEMMAAGGVVRLQPGIESLSTSILKLMGKGTSRLQNIRLLKWCEEFGIGLAWNFLTGFPGEDPGEYDDMAGLVPSIVHLPAPTGSGVIRLDRFSPYWHKPERHGLANVRAFWAYDIVYEPLPSEERARLAYFFQFDYADGRDPAGYTSSMLTQLELWRHAYNVGKAKLEFVEDDVPAIMDTRGLGHPELTPIDRADRAILVALDAGRNRASLDADRLGLAEIDLEQRIDVFRQRAWIIAENDVLVSLVVDRAERDRVFRKRVDLHLEDYGLLEPA